MNDQDDLDNPEPAPPPRRGRLRRFAVRATVVLVVIALLLFVSRFQIGRLGQRQLNATTGRLDAEDPGWRLDAILAEREANAPPPDKDSAAAVLVLAERIPREWNQWQFNNEADPWPGSHPDNHLPPDTIVEKLHQHAEASKPVRDEALKLREKRAGQYPLQIASDPLGTLLPHLDKARTVIALLQYDAYLAGLEKNPNRGIAAARAALATCRSIGDEPLLVSQLVRLACNKVAADITVQTLAWGEPTEGLAELQTELLVEADVPWFQIGIRGERALYDKMFVGLENGTIPIDNTVRYFQIGNPGPQHYAAFRAYRPFLRGDHAKCLQLLTEYYEASKLPHHEQLLTMKQIPVPPGPPDDFRYVVTRLMLPACDKFAAGGLRVRAELLTAAVAVACERFRRKHNRWPDNLAELTPAFLPAVPLNPFDGKPVAYRRLPDRIAVYCFWANSPQVRITDPPKFLDPNAKGVGIGCRAWNPDRRALPPEEKQKP